MPTDAWVTALEVVARRLVPDETDLRTTAEWVLRALRELPLEQRMEAMGIATNGNPDSCDRGLGKADWLYQRTDPSEDFVAGMHLPCCSMVLPSGRNCGNGPLTGQQIEQGDCGEHPTEEDLFGDG